ncbi:hypothetical protein [Larkinella soli]|uniref:hypothetical protein n=1 Tax=Larkinella soli TaxID=1770527 RepID=UPI000FFC1D9C|nr:hypothetical protein [Larkinella soli]
MKQLFSLLIGLFLFSITARAQNADTLRTDTTTVTRPPARIASDTIPSYEKPKTGLDWFWRSAGFGGASLGFGLGQGQGLYATLSPRLGLFIQDGFAIGLRGSFERRASTSYRANSGGAFVRYYPLRGNFFAFGEAGFNIGKYSSSNVGPDDSRRFSNLNIGLGVGFRASGGLGLELMIENNYYDKTPVFAGRNRGPQLKVGANFHIGARR